MLRVEGLTKVFTGRGGGKTVAVKDLSFHSMPGEIYGLLGPNGAGKTTTLRCLSTLLKPTAGNAWIDDISVLEHGESFRSRIGFLTSDMKLDGYFTPEYLTDWFGRLNRVPGEVVRERRKALFSELQMEDFAGRRIDDLPTGMKQKTAIAVSLIHDPEVIIFDEPTNGLDVITSKAVTDFLRKRAEAGKTIVLSTHIMTVAEKLCHRFGIIAGGEMKAEGTLQEVAPGGNLEEVFFGHILPGRPGNEG